MANRRSLTEPLPRGRVRLAVVAGPRTEGAPVTRGDCEPCPSCQEWRDGGYEGQPGCAHTADEAIARSRPCVFVGCRHALYLEATKAGSVVFNWPELEPDEMRASCSLDVAELPQTQSDVARVLGVTKARVGKIEEKALLRLARGSAARLLRRESRE